jgi:phenylalanyl-tRNA synthetase alpha chain
MKSVENKGHLHPLTQIIIGATAPFLELGFEIAEGPELEDEWHNFDALNVPANHPARDMQDTFWIKPLDSKKLLRTHTSPVQVRYMLEKLAAGVKPPYRIVVPGKVFRNEATDARHEAQFHQIEGLMVDRKVTVADMKGALEFFLRRLYGDNTKIRLRPSFFPFVEPGFEIDMVCCSCGGSGLKNQNKCSTCSGSGWIEIMGAGLVHPHVFRSVGLDPEEWQGFAFGIGLERLAMLKFGFDDVRTLFAGDLRLINQF